MNRTNTTARKVMRRTALALSLCIFSSTQSALAENNCKQAKGNTEEVHFPPGNTTTGTLFNGGWLKGTTLLVFGQASFPFPNIEVFPGQYTITTNQGQLKTRSIVLFDLAGLKATMLAIIDPDSSTGIFAGATGTLFLNYAKINFSSTRLTFHSEVSAEVCFARH